jgi:hypothetical protein
MIGRPLKKIEKFRFFNVTHDAFKNFDFPWVSKLAEGEIEGKPCRKCGGTRHPGSGAITVSLVPKRGQKWPDLLGIGSASMLIVSENVIRAWEMDNLAKPQVYKVIVPKPYPEKIADIPPAYYWIDGGKAIGARLDFDTSTVPEPGYCLTCGQCISEDYETYRQRYPQVWQCKFKDESWNGACLFTTDLSPFFFFCTHELIDCACRHHLTNFLFIPLEDMG